MRKFILKWIFGVDMVDMDTYSELLNKYGQSLEEHKDTLKMLEEMIDRCEENIQFMSLLKEKLNDLEEHIDEQQKCKFQRKENNYYGKGIGSKR